MDSNRSFGLILMYHRVADEAVDPWGLCVSPTRFAEQMASIAERSVPTPLADFLENPLSGRDSRVVVTFDDGYADNLHNALPILERYGIPATVFIVAGAIDQNREFWWDELEHILLTPGQLPRELELEVQGRKFSRVLTTELEYSASQLARELTSEVFESLPGSRLHLFKELWEFLCSMPEPLQRVTLAKLWVWSGQRGDSRPSHRVLTLEELKQLSGSPLIEIGAHTMTHPQLPRFTLEEQEREIVECKAVLERNLTIAVDSFSYPFGRYDRKSAEIVEAAGFKRAVIAKPGPLDEGPGAFALPRTPIGNWTGAELCRHLSR